ncbi:hypothetical protein BDN70DRAFT_676615 [Pholiota conissans]|uniref:Uncharacterized protein n=1 Tax=Pholiota conissans TaxID=109636 RepID=A0A9P6D6Y4_9AGAR|nr:hypothetical protein BDN70DRAFT_676615 [Pholiota conissans]
MSSFIFQQDIFPEKKDIRIHCQRCNEADWAKFLPQFIDSIEDNRIGISTMHGTNGASKTLVISSNSRIIAISISPKASRSSRKGNSPFNQLQDLLCNPKLFKYSLEMDKVSTALFLDFGLTIVAAKDLLSLSTEHSRHSLEACLFALGGSGNIEKQAVKRVFSDKKVTSNDFERASLQAWAVCHAASIPAVHELLQTARLINTFEFDKEILQVLCRAIRDANRLWALKPVRVKNDVHEKHKALSNDEISLVCKRYKSKISDRPRNNQVCIKLFRRLLKADTILDHQNREHRS